MKRSQQVIIGIGVLVVLGMCIVPPFHFPRRNKYLPIWTNRPGRLDTTRLCIQIGAVAILTGGLVFLAKQRRERGNEGIIIPWGKLAATSAKVATVAAIVAVLIIVALIITSPISRGKKAEANRLLTDLSKVKLEPLKIWGHGLGPYLKCRLYNGTDKTLNDLQVYLYVNNESDRVTRSVFERIGREYSLSEIRAIDQVLPGSPRITLEMAESEIAASAVSARVYKQDSSFIGPVPPHSWSEVNIELSNCPDVEKRSHWLVLLKAAEWQKASK